MTSPATKDLPPNNDTNLLVQWFKNGDHPEDNCEVWADGPFKGAKKEGQVVRYFRLPNMGDETCPKCGKVFHDHGFLDRRTPSAAESTPAPDPIEVSDNAEPVEPRREQDFPGLVCPGDWILKTVMTPGKERYVVKRPQEVLHMGNVGYTEEGVVQRDIGSIPQLPVDQAFKALEATTPALAQEKPTVMQRMKAHMSNWFGG